MIAFCETWPEDRQAHNQGNGLARGWRPSARHADLGRNPVNSDDIRGVYQLSRMHIRRSAVDAGGATVQGGFTNG